MDPPTTKNKQSNKDYSISLIPSKDYKKLKDSDKLKQNQEKVNQYEDKLIDTKRDIAGKNYMFFFLKLTNQLYTLFCSMQKQHKFTLASKLFSQRLTKKVAQSIINQLKNNKEKKLKQQEKQEFDVWNQYKDGIQINNITKILNSIEEFIQTKGGKQYKDVNGDFDIVLTQLIGLDKIKTINKYFTNLKETNREECWVIEDYLKTLKIIQGKQPQKQSRYIFQLKSNPFGQYQVSKQDIQNKKKWKRRFLKKSSNKQNLKKQFHQNSEQQFEDEQNNDSVNQIKYNDDNFQSVILEHLAKDNMLQIVSQIVKLVYGGIHYHYKKSAAKQIESNNFAAFLQDRFEGQKQQIHNKDQKQETKQTNQYRQIIYRIPKVNHPPIVIYFVINHSVSQQTFREYFQIVRPLLKHIFLKCKAVLNIIGISQKEEETMNQLKQKMLQQQEKFLQRQQQYRSKLVQLEKDMQRQHQKHQKQQQKVKQLIQQNQQRDSQIKKLQQLINKMLMQKQNRIQQNESHKIQQK